MLQVSAPHVHCAALELIQERWNQRLSGWGGWVTPYDFPPKRGMNIHRSQLFWGKAPGFWLIVTVGSSHNYVLLTFFFGVFLHHFFFKGNSMGPWAKNRVIFQSIAWCLRRCDNADAARVLGKSIEPELCVAQPSAGVRSDRARSQASQFFLVDRSRFGHAYPLVN